jgi:hypothetical protein
MKPHVLEAREYKLLLDPTKFAGEPAELAGTFWDEQLKPIIEARLEPRDSGKPRARKAFEERKHRRIRFRDTPACLLDRFDYSLRERVGLVGGREDDASRQMTLKLRTPDLSFTAATDLPGALSGARTKFEEDVSPLQVARAAGKGKTLALAEPRSTRSRFSLSTTQMVVSAAFPKTLGGLLALYPTLEDYLDEAPETDRADDAPLVSGPDIDETVLTGAQVDLGQSVKAGLALTFWYFQGANQPTVAEISFRCELDAAGQMPRTAARRARTLFVGLQDGLGAWLSSRDTSKTILAQPCQFGTTK